MTTIAAALAAARQHIEASEARLLLRRALGCSAAHLLAHDGDELEPAMEAAFVRLVQRRQEGEPIAYLTGVREFYGRDFHVAPGVLIPRHDTELMIDVALAKGNPERVLDMGTGSGCLAVTLALELPRAQVVAIDVSPEALAIAAGNALRLGAHVRWQISDWFNALADERFDLIVSNPPYIPHQDPHLALGDLRFEPMSALASGTDGLDALRQIVSRARNHLHERAWLLLEHGYDQADAVRDLLKHYGYQQIEQHRDLSGIIRISGGRHS